MTAEKLSLHRKLAQVMYEAERIPKNGRAPKEMGGYEFVQVGDAADYIRKALAEKVITMMPVGVQVVGQADRLTAKGGNMTTVDLVTTWRLTDGESGESIEIQSFGAGADGGDKYSGKAMTSAMKYALLSGFLLSTGEDSEAANLPEQRSERNPRVGAPDYQPPEPSTANGGLIGIATKGVKITDDFHVRITTKGPFLGFRLKDGGKTGFLMEVLGPLAEDLYLMETKVIGERVQVWGHWVTNTLDNGRQYDAYRVERIAGPTFALPESSTPVAGAPERPSKTEVAGASDLGSPAPAALDAEIDALPMFQEDAAA